MLLLHHTPNDSYYDGYPIRHSDQCGKRRLHPHRYGEGYRTEYRQHHEEEGADGVYHEGGISVKENKGSYRVTTDYIFNENIADQVDFDVTE